MLEKIRNNKMVAAICTYIDSPIFPAVLGVAALLFYILALPMVGLVAFGLVFAFVFFFSNDTRPALAVALLAFLTLRYKYDVGAYLSTPAIVCYCVFGPVVLASIVVRFIAYERPKHNHGVLLGLVLTCTALFFGGAFSDYYRIHNVYNALALTGGFCGVYVLFSYTLKHREDNLVYIARICTVALCVIAVQVLDFYIREYKMGTPLDGDWKSQIVLGWGISNLVGEMSAMLFPAVFYLIYKENRGYLYYLAVVVGYVAVYFTLGRNALICSSVVVVVGIVVNCFVGKNRKANACIAVAILVVGLIVVLSLKEAGKFKLLLAFFANKKLDDNGRFKIWKEYIELFKENPVLGVGFAAHRIVYPGQPLNAHNTLLQMLSSTGIVGLALYLFHRFQTVVLFVKKPSFDRLFVGSCLITGVIASLLDPLFFRTYFTIYYAALLLVIEKSSEYDERKTKLFQPKHKK